MKAFLLCFVPLFVAVNAIGFLPVFIGLTQDIEAGRRKRIIIQSVLTAATIVGCAGLVPFAAGEVLIGQKPVFTLAGVVGVLYAGLLLTVGCFLSLLWALRYVQATQAAALTYLQPVVGVVIAWFFLGERLTSVFFVGAALVLMAISFFNRPDPEPAQPQKVRDGSGDGRQEHWPLTEEGNIRT